MKIITKTLAIALSLFFAGSVIAEETKVPEWLFVHTAATAEMTSENTLVMPVTREIFAFTDRPYRLHTYLNTHEFVSFWDEGKGDSFKADPPNAVLTWVEGDAVKEAEVVITDAAPAEHGRFIKYTVEVVAGAAPQTLSKVSMFIDDIAGVIHALRCACTICEKQWLRIHGC
jgi:hypothetical protein